MPSRFNLPHLDLSAFASLQPYMGVGSGGGGSAVRIREEHGRRLQNELTTALALADEVRPSDDRLDAPSGVYLEVELRPGTKPDALDRKRAHVRSGAAKTQDNGYRTIALFVPDHARPILDRILSDYLNGPLGKSRKPPHSDKVEAVEAIRRARLETLWTDAKGTLPGDAHAQLWWGLWCRPEHEAEVETACQRLNLRVAGRDRRLRFPEIVVLPAFGSRVAIELLLFSTGLIAELRRADDTPVFFTDDIAGDQHEWSDNLAARVVWPPSDAPRVCIFDTGVNRAHSLIEPALAPGDMHALDDDWGKDDHDRLGHGTSMAGLALHGDLTAGLSDASERSLGHRLESVKLLPPRGFDPNEPHSYGFLTQAAVALPEFAAPEATRVFCMAVTNQDVSGASPSSWSAALDQLAAGAMPGDEEDAPKRLIVVAAGNVPGEMDASRIGPQDDYPIEDPAQAWNALTVGGYTDLVDIRDDGFETWSPMAAVGDLSPHSRTSTSWKQGSSPFKPEFVFEGGNRALNPARTEATNLSSLSLLTTGSDVGREPLVPFQATSAASAQAARMAAQLSAANPNFWPETIRALMVHSAEYTAPMVAAFSNRVRDNYGQIRRFGYGVPDFDRANASATNHLAMVAQMPIQPFKSMGRKFNQCHYYALPIPRAMLEELGNEPVELKVTLSYFVEPNPGMAASVEPQRYQSFGLRFDLRRKNESMDNFKLRVNAADREDARVGPPTGSDDGRWLLGPKSVSAGSLHSDTWSGPAIELIGRDTLCVKPVNGWWKERQSPEVCNRKARYALVISFKAKNVDVDVYTPISVAIRPSVTIDVFS